MSYFKWDALFQVFPRLVKCIPVTLGITTASFSAGLILAVLIAISRIYKIPVLTQLSSVYVSFMRGTPILIQLFIVKLAFPTVIWVITGINVGRIWPQIVFVIIAYSLNSAAFLSEIIRASFFGVDTAQHEAAYAAGMTASQSFVHVIFPQMFRISIPSIANSLSGLLKDTSLAYSAAGVIDVMGMVSANNALTYRFFEGYIGAAVIFFSLCLVIQQSFKYLEYRLDYGKFLTKEV
ncbi:MAG: amino acid ABC transporter permease [Treponema sp.]|jgi:L-cystine transport system permease protein|nr:amino acid ABC transporter permease [Treponema sp.]